MYLISQSFKYAVTKDPKVRENCHSTFESIERLYKVTNIKGLMARTCCLQNETHETENWHNSTNPDLKGWVWKGDTSTDEVISYYAGLPIYAELVCENQEEK